MAMGFTGPTTTFKKTPPYFWFCHSCHRSSSSFPMAASSRSFWASSKSHKNLCRWQVQNFHNAKDRLLNVSVVCSSFRFNSRSNFNTMSFDESGSYINMEHNQPFTDASFYADLKRGDSYASVLPHGVKKGSPGSTCVTSILDTQPFSGYSLCVVYDGGNSYARMLPRGIKQGVPRNTCITPSSDAHPPMPFQNKEFQPQSWYQEIQEMEKMKQETCLEMSLPIPNVQKAEYIVSEPCKPEAQDGSAFAKFPSQTPNGHARTGALGKLKASSAPHSKAINKQHKYEIRGESKDPKKKQSSLQAMPVNGVRRSDLQLRNHVVENEYGNSVSNDEDSKETYIVPLDSRDFTKNNILRERLNSIYDKVLVIDNISAAKEVVRKLTNQYRDLVHACDTEVAAIDVKQETPVDHGEVICFSIYSGHEADFGNGKSCIWVDVLDGGGKNLLEVFSPFFEDPSIKKVWHNYSFDNHVLENYGLKLSGFHADTMHMARLWDSSRRMSGGYSLEALTSDSKGIMSGANLGPNEELIGKVSMKTIFGRKKLKKDGSEGKVVVIPAVEELQRTEREPWVCYSALDSISTLKLYERLKTNLSNREWKLNGITKGTLFDFYEQYWRPFGELLVKMETEGMLVDRAYLAEIEKVATAEQQIAADRFRSWASKLCPDAKFMNVRSDAQLRQLFFGGIENSKDPAKSLPMENEFKVPNVDNVIEEGKKTATKFRKIKLKAICPGLETEMYTASGWPSISGDVLKNLAGKVSMEYDFADKEDTELDENADDIPEVELSKTKRKTPSNNSEASYGTAYAAFGGGSEGREACHAIAALCEVCSIDSLISNFILPLQGSHISGRNGRVHCSLNINTETGRLSARRPNLQNQPALEKDRYKIRQAFIAAPGNSLIVADYGQLELRILAHLANCKSMLDAFKAGGDFHSRTAMNMYPYIRDAVDSKEVLLEWHPQPGQESPPVPLLKDMFGSERRKAKMLNFSIAYGKTAVGLSRDWKVSVDEAKETVARWYRGREEVLKWQEARKREARSIGCVYTLLGRARTFPSTKNATGSQKGHIERAAINTPVQGSAADVATCAMLEISKNARLKELGWRLLLQVHDEVILEGPTDSAEVAKAIVVECMSKPFDGKNILKVDLSVDAKFAKNWYSAK